MDPRGAAERQAAVTHADYVLDRARAAAAAAEEKVGVAEAEVKAAKEAHKDAKQALKDAERAAKQAQADAAELPPDVEPAAVGNGTQAHAQPAEGQGGVG